MMYRASHSEPLEGRVLFAGTPLYLTETSSDAGLVLSIDGSPGDDRISIVATADGLVLANKGGWYTILPDHFALIRINAARGNDTVIVDGSVTTDAIVHGSNGDDTLLGGAGDDQLFGGQGRDRILAGAGDDTIVSLGDSIQDRVSGDGGFDSFWTDAHKTELITDASDDELSRGAVHRIAAFVAPETMETDLPKTRKIYDAPSRELDGQDLPDPIGSPSYVAANNSFADRPLFASAGPTPLDIKQGAVGDCYFLVALMAIAKDDPARIRQMITDLGDGTYAVRFYRSGAEMYYRVDGQLQTFNSSGAHVWAKLGAEQSVWVALIEKAYTFFRRNDGNYMSIRAGWMTEAFDVCGLASESFMGRTLAGVVEQMTRVKQAMDDGATVTWATQSKVPAGTPVLSGHAYVVLAINMDADGGFVSLVLRNPWGSDGAGNDGANDGVVTVTLDQANAAFLGAVYARV
jgi:Ca2+-binding RTX toxin-like protein